MRYWLFVLPLSLACSLVAGSGDFEIVDGSTDAPVDAGIDVGGCTNAAECVAREATTDCIGGSCVITSCNDGFGDCDELAATGCESDLTALDNCGACNDRCDLPSATEACMDGDCQIVSCATGTEDCDGILDNGCEANLTSPGSCGNCSRRCMGDTPICDTSTASARCVESCDPPGLLCDFSCVNTASDPLHCGGCDPCSVPDRATATCSAGVCDFECESGFDDCNSMAGDGCEVTLATSLAHCGGCGQACMEVNATQVCMDSTCVPDCDDDWGDCNGDPSDGCEQSLLDDADHCGMCGAPCGGPCAAGVCDPPIDLSLGYTASCAVRQSNRVYCWGTNDRGQLGTGDSAPRGRPTRVVGVDGVGLLLAKQVSSWGASPTQTTSCAILMDDTLACWGNNTYGTVGADSASAPVLTPRLVSSTDPEFASRTFTTVDASNETACALDSLGDMWCWGRNTVGELGVPTTTTAARPSAERVALGGPAEEISVGNRFACARRDTGAVLCWGENTNGELGDTTNVRRHTPMRVALPADDATGIGAGSQHACALRGSRVWCWGIGAVGQLGTGTAVNSRTPLEATALGSDVVSLHVIFNATFVTSGTGVHRAVGGNAVGQLGDGTRVDALAPVSPIGVGVDARLVTSSFAGAIEPDRALSWGDDLFGQLGRDADLVLETPTDIAQAGITSVSMGFGAGCAGTASDTYCFGRGANGQLGIASFQPTSTPARVAGIIGPSAGGFYACGIRSLTNQAACWGANGNGQIGHGMTSNPSVPTNTVPMVSPVSDIASGDEHTCAIVSAPGEVFCWGNNSSSQLGRSTAPDGFDRSPGAAVAGIDDAVALVSGIASTCALRENETVACWGAGGSGQIGDGASTPRATATQVSAISNVVAITGGERHYCAIVGAVADASEGAVYCWGDNSRGAVGDPGGVSTHAVPFSVGIADAVAIGSGAQHTCALRAGGEIQCWGRNDEMQLGDGTRIQRNSPVTANAVTGAVGLSSGAWGSYTQCAWRADGTAVCWGYCIEGSCGNGAPLAETTPDALQTFGP